ncbi:hypothetical protein FKM82_008033 [Ascaphus truei]
MNGDESVVIHWGYFSGAYANKGRLFSMYDVLHSLFPSLAGKKVSSWETKILAHINWTVLPECGSGDVISVVKKQFEVTTLDRSFTPTNVANVTVLCVAATCAHATVVVAAPED